MRFAWVLVVVGCGSPKRVDEVTLLPQPSASAIARPRPTSSAVATVTPGILPRWGLDVWVSIPPPGGIAILPDDGSESDRPIPRAAVQRVVVRNIDAFRRCDPSHATGAVVVHATIDTTGAVTQADLDAATTLPDPTATTCVVDLFRSLQFPRPGGGTAILVYPIRFR